VNVILLLAHLSAESAFTDAALRGFTAPDFCT